ncbi:MAG: EthD family reductase [Chitinophagales bacterium]|nr:EthD family reductase [Chitinophagales bacterium]
MIIKPIIVPVLFLLASLTSCKTNQMALSPTSKSGMYKVTILYPDGEGKTFDMNYYEQKHMPMMAGFLGENLKFYEIDKGILGRSSSEKPTFLAVGYFFITSIDEYNIAIAQNREAVMSDIKNYTNIQPIVQISEIRQVKNKE